MATQAEEPSGSENRGPSATIDAEKMNFDQVSKIYTAEGNVIIRYKDDTLRADRVKFNTETKDAWAEGHVRLNQPGEEWVAPSLFYNFDTHALKADNIRGFVNPLYLSGEQLQQVDTNHYVFTRGTATTCDYDRPDYHLEGTHGEIWPGDRVVMYDATLRFGDVPVFWFPIVVWSLKGDNPPLLFSVGDDSRWGAFLLSSYSWNVNRDVQVTVHADERTRRGFGTGADVKYRFGSAGEGLLTGYYINDAKPKDTTDVGKDIGHNRYRGEWQHKQYWTNDVTLTVDLHKLSDSDVEDDFFRHEFRHNREPDSVADVTKRGPDYTLSLLTRPQFNDFFAEVERLPEAKLAINRTRLGHTPFFYEGESSVGEYHNDPGNTNVVGAAGTNFVGNAVRADTFHQIVAPQLLGGWLSVIPRAGVRATYYSRAPESAAVSQDVARVVYDLGMETSFKMSRSWDGVQSDWFRIDGLRHIMQPFADYQWVPRPDKTTNELFQFDSVREVKLRGGDMLSATRYSPLEFPAYNTIDAIDAQDVVRFGMRQTVQTRRDGEAWNLVDLTGWTDWRIEKEKGQTDFSDFFGTMELRPYAWLKEETSTRYGLNDGVLHEFNTAARVIDADRWSFGVGTRYLKGDSNLVSGDFACRLTRHWTAHIYEQVDLEDGTWEEQEYVLRQETHDWLINYGFRYLTQRTQKDEMTAFFSVTLKAFPKSTLAVN
ncbi:MAG TPA: LPS assembly protein LptD [Verrucomicrobiae bacterium]|nr:LPS assembly protein LptD [Verrucomicrobiae bacterium]